MLPIHAMSTICSLFNLGGPDLIIIVSIMLLLFGAKNLPGLGRGMGHAVRGLSDDPRNWKYDGHDLIVAIAIFLLLLLTIAAATLINPRF